MIDGDRVDLVFRLLRRGAENTGGNFLGFLDRILLRNRVRHVDGKEFGLAARSRRRCDRVGGDLALERTYRHEGVDRFILGHLADLVRRELADRDLVGIDAGFFQDHAQQLGDIGLRPPDHADVMAGEFIENLS